MRRTLLILAIVAGPCLISRPLRAQSRRVPFFDRGATAFDPEIGIVNSGIVADMQAVASPDNKYVTINARVSNSRLLALKEFAFQQPTIPGGFVGSQQQTAPGEPRPRSILDQPGMTRLEAHRGRPQSR